MWNWLGDEFFIHAFEEILLSSNRHFEVVNCSKQFVRTHILTTQSKVKASLPYWMHLSVFSICIIRFKISRMQFIWYLQYVQLQKSGHRSPGTNKDPPSIPKTCLQCLMKTNNIRQFDHVIRFSSGLREFGAIMSGTSTLVEQVYTANDLYTAGDEHLEVCKFNVDRSPFGELFGELLFMQVDNSSGSAHRNASFLTRAGLSAAKSKSWLGVLSLSCEESVDWFTSVSTSSSLSGVSSLGILFRGSSGSVSSKCTTITLVLSARSSRSRHLCKARLINLLGFNKIESLNYFFIIDILIELAYGETYVTLSPNQMPVKANQSSYKVLARPPIFRIRSFLTDSWTLVMGHYDSFVMNKFIRCLKFREKKLK